MQSASDRISETLHLPSKNYSKDAQTPLVRRTAKYGWKADLPDHRDQRFTVQQDTNAKLPALIDLRTSTTWPDVYDQGQIGSCTANAIAGAFEYLIIKEASVPDFTPSRLFIYYNERAMEGSIGTDSGAQIRDGIKSVATQGVCTEDMWPYDGTAPNPTTLAWPAGEQPPQECYQSALNNLALKYKRVKQDANHIKACLAAGFPVVFGFTVYESFESATVTQTGVVPMPQPNEQVLGGHAVVAVGYDDSQQMLWVRNSWGSGWGQQGYFQMPYAYLTNSDLADDLWTITLDN